ncbi:hypothetical protein [Streptomyces chartreusis]|uniref:hypothetical protein n=1 Tax=Streptomyces chartreusis TaxID=1969 RepID=UPI0038306C10
MTYTHTDLAGRRLIVTPTTGNGTPGLNIRTADGDRQNGIGVELRIHQVEDIVDGLHAVRREAVDAHPGTPALQPAPHDPTTSTLGQQLAEALRRAGGPAAATDANVNAVLAVILPATQFFGVLHRSAHQDLKRVTALYQQWVNAGPPPADTPNARWWDSHLIQLHDALQGSERS